MGVSLRPYQAEALVALREARGTDGTAGSKIRRALVVLATGLGKTIVMAALPRALNLQRSEALLILAHREELISQTVTKVKREDPRLKVGVEKASSYRATEDCDVIVASVQTLKGPRLDDFVSMFAKKISVIAIDEAHHAVAPGYQNIVASFPNAFIIGVTATPRRGDQIGLGEAFDRIVIHRDLEWGIEHGYLVPLKSFVAKSDIDLGDVASRGGDFAEKQLSATINNNARNALIVKTFLQHVPDKKGLVFCASVDHAEAVTREFCQRGILAACASAETKEFERKVIVENFRQNKIQVLINCGLYVEGFDVPTVEFIINARPTKSPALYAQIVGRALRPLDECAGDISVLTDPKARRSVIARSKKPAATVIDILDGTPRPGLQSLPTLWGLPSNFDTKGGDVRAAVKKFLQVSARNPEAASAALSVEDFEVALQEIDAFAPPLPDAIVVESSKYNWLRIPGDAYRLSLPPAYVPVGTTPEELAMARRNVGRLVREAQVAGERDPIRAVEDQIGKQVATVEEWVEITPTLLERWETKVYQNVFRSSNPVNERSRVIVDTPDRTEAFREADAWLMENRRDFLSITDRSASWRTEEISKGQQSVLTRKFKVPKRLLPATKGEAHDLINRLKNEQPGVLQAGPAIRKWPSRKSA